MRLYHATTPKKLARYAATGSILPPVRGWSTEAAAREWGRRCGRSIVLVVEIEPAYPLPDHKNKHGRAYWTPKPCQWRPALAEPAS